MDWRAVVRAHLKEITGDPVRDAEIVDELAQHYAARFDELRAGGMPEANAAAAIEGELQDHPGLARAIRQAERARPSAPVPPAPGRQLLGGLGRDLRYAGRLLRRAPGFTAAAVLTLALGIGMTTAIFTVVQAVLLRQVPFPDADRLVMMWETDRNSGTTREPASLPDLLDYRQRSRQVDRVGSFTPSELTLLPERGDPRRVSGLGATPDLIELLGLTTIAGRMFTPDEDRAGGPALAVISERLWTDLFNRDASAVGARIQLNGVPRTIVGVVSASADFGVQQMLSAAAYAARSAERRPRIDVWLPLQADPSNPRNRRGGNHAFLMLGRLAPGATVDRAHAEMTRIAAELEREYADDNAGRGAFVEPLDDVVFGSTRTALTVLMAAVSLVLLIACANVVNLLLTRSIDRAREVAVRVAVGAEMPRLVRQFAVESVVLALAAAALGVPLASGVLRALVVIVPPGIPRLDSVGLDAGVLALAVGLAGVIGLAAGFVPVVQVRRTDLQGALKADDGRGATAGGDRQRLRSALVVTEVTLAVVLVCGAGLLIRSFWHLSRTDPGFDVAGVLKAEVQLPPRYYPPSARGQTEFPMYTGFVDGLLERAGRLPGVEAVGLAANHPLDTGFTQSFFVVGREAEAEDWPELWVRHVSPGYFRALRVPLVRGRMMSDADTAAAQQVVLLNQATVDRFFPNQDPVGQQINFWGIPRTIVGIVGNERFHGLAKAAPIGGYAPLAQTRMSELALVVRTGGDPAALAASVRSVIHELDPQLAVFGLEPLEDTLAHTLGEPRFMMLLLALFAGLAIVLAAVGVQGVLAHLVAQRVREIGVRLTLGASAGEVVRLVLGHGMRLVGIGLALGLVLTLVLGRALAGLLYGIEATDVPTLAAALALFGVIALVAMWIPVRRAARLDPLAALRQE